MTSFDNDYMHLEPYADKWRAFNWNVVEINGHDMGQIVDALDNLPPITNENPTVIIASTIKGKGVSFMERDIGWHAGALSEEDTKKALADIEADYARVRSST
jgi:transketolase